MTWVDCSCYKLIYSKMKLRTLTFNAALLVILVIAVQSCNQVGENKAINAGVENFRSLQFSETPFDTEKGLHKLTAEEALEVNNYKLSYDDQGRIASVEYCRGDELLSYGSLGGATRVVYAYEDGKQLKSYFNKAGEQISSGGVYKAVYELDKDGIRTALKFYGENGEAVENRNNIHRYEWSKLESGLIRELRYNLAEEETVMNPFCPFYELRFEYDSKGFAVSMYNYEADTLYNCTAENCGDIGVSYFEFKNSDSGDLLSFSVHNTVGQLSNLYWGWAKRLNKVDDKGYLVERAVYDQDDEYISGKNVPVTQYSYDEHGAMTEMRNLDTERNLINSPGNGVAITRFNYDDKGNRTGSVRFDVSGAEVLSEQ